MWVFTQLTSNIKGFAHRHAYVNLPAPCILTLQLIPVTLSMVVSVVSTNTLLGVPAEAYSYGIQFGLYSVGVMIATTLVGTFFIPLLFPLKMTSAHEVVNHTHVLWTFFCRWTFSCHWLIWSRPNAAALSWGANRWQSSVSGSCSMKQLLNDMCNWGWL